MSQAKLTLRPPPNIEFVQGYPGIPPLAPDRNQAAVKGTIELRLGPQGVKAKWVRIELRKVESLPGGGQTNTFFDCVGQSPITIWQAPDEWSMMNNKDFSFYIRIPESIPPSISLDKGAGIRYELVATLCYKGKSGFFRRSSSSTLWTSAPVIIDKHELHSTWPIYAQPETRQIVADGLTLTVDRTHTCYGPGDRVAVLATLRSDSLTTVVLRAFEFLLKETIVFRAEPHVSGKKSSGRKGGPQVKATPIGDQKVPVNVTLFGGTAHRVELSCTIPQTHTTTTVTAARHIDIAYIINVRAILATGKSLSMDLPVIISNWPRNVSIEAVRRIGPAPNLTLTSTTTHMISAGLTQHVQRPNTATQGINSVPQNSITGTTNSLHPTAPAKSSTVMHPYANQNDLDQSLGPTLSRPNYAAEPLVENTAAADHSIGEFGHVRGTTLPSVSNSQPATFAGYSAHRQNILSDDNVYAASLSSPDATRHRPGAIGGKASHWLTNSNANEFENYNAIRTDNSARHLQSGLENTIPDTLPSAQEQPHLAVNQRTPSALTPNHWLPAEEEKQRLFNQAKADVARVQSGMGVYIPAQHSQDQDHQPITAYEDAGRIMTSAIGQLPSEDEKLRLFERAQEVARMTQARAAQSNTHDHTASNQSTTNRGEDLSAHHSLRSSDSLASLSAGAKMYSNAMSSLHRGDSLNRRNQQPHSAPVTNRTFSTAEQEKAALRYYEAKQAVDRHAGASDSIPPSDNPIAYDALYPSNPAPITASGGISSSMPQSSIQDSALIEKERLRKKFELLDATSNTGPTLTQPSVLSHSSPLPLASAPLPIYNSSPIRMQPSPPAQQNGFRPLTAAEEKARLRKQYENEDDVVKPQTSTTAFSSPMPKNGLDSTLSRKPSSSATYTPIGSKLVSPPPLMPRPPAEYIRETEEEDARTQAEEHTFRQVRSEIASSSSSSQADPPASIIGLDMRPFTPFNPDLGMGNGGMRLTNLPPPPLPPKLQTVE